MQDRNLSDHRQSHARNSHTEHVGFSPTRKTSRAPSGKRHKVFGESHEGWAASYCEPLVRRTSAPCAHVFLRMDDSIELLDIFYGADTDRSPDHNRRRGGRVLSLCMAVVV